MFRVQQVCAFSLSITSSITARAQRQQKQQQQSQLRQHLSSPRVTSVPPSFYPEMQSINAQNSSRIGSRDGEMSYVHQFTCYEVIKCVNCETTQTPCWRLGKDGQFSCNKCGLYLLMNGIPKPLNRPTMSVAGQNRERQNSESKIENVKTEKFDFWRMISKLCSCISTLFNYMRHIHFINAYNVYYITPEYQRDPRLHTVTNSSVPTK
uniref:GATA-type domain-containing protein n=1 Tax=Tetranychus urticae TaxID=32264 RepID=T1K6T0_TETUR